MERVIDPFDQTELLVPPFATSDMTIARAERARRGEIREVRFASEHGHRWPLWDVIEGPLEPYHLGISAELTAKLRRWHDVWIANVSVKSRWESPAVRQVWNEEGRGLALELFEEIWWSADVADVHWDDGLGVYG
ncbi:hypothetical protein [Gulosibacter sp. 10]|uniref:hypothetical protein n=1 Tax=Gulosibacter sp. 10 TaxID=1255570 RepID=UPI001123651A|nr:hypothetical protein [Gulosibacter sp. 10]